MRRWLGGVIFLVYVVIGVVVAAGHHYFVLGDLGVNTAIFSAVLAVLLWPLILLDVSLHF